MQSDTYFAAAQYRIKLYSNTVFLYFFFITVCAVVLDVSYYGGEEKIMSEVLGKECSKTAKTSLCLSFAFHLSFFPSN